MCSPVRPIPSNKEPPDCIPFYPVTVRIPHLRYLISQASVSYGAQAPPTSKSNLVPIGSDQEKFWCEPIGQSLITHFSLLSKVDR